MSSSLPAAQFPALALSKEKAAVEPIYKDTVVAAREPSDDELLPRISNGDREALAVLFRRYCRLVWSVADRILRNKAEADDVLQDVFLLIQRKASVFDSSKGTARSLIVHITYQQALSRRRYLNSRQATGFVKERESRVSAPAAPLYDESVEAHFGRQRLQDALKELSEVQRTTLERFFVEGYTMNEIAERSGQSLGQVKHHYYRGLAKLRKYLLQQ